MKLSNWRTDKTSKLKNRPKLKLAKNKRKQFNVLRKKLKT